MKQRLGAQNALYPLPAVLVGALVEGRPNFITISHLGVLTTGQEEFIGAGMNKVHFTNAGIRQTGTFSVCIPDEKMVELVDYCGLVSGKNVDKSEVFEVFYGELGTAPMVAQCPVCMECRLHQVIDFPDHDLFIGEIVETHAEPEVLQEGRLDLGRIRPLLFDLHGRQYWALGRPLAAAWKAGLKLMEKEQG